MNEKPPRINVPVLYPLGFEPGVSEAWVDIVNECFHLAMLRLHERVQEAGYGSEQGSVSGPHEMVQGVTVPVALGFFPNKGEQPVAATDPPGGPEDPEGIRDFTGKLLTVLKGYGVFMKLDDGSLQPCVTEEKRTFLVYQGPIEAAEKALQKDEATVVAVQLAWDPEADAKRRKSGRRA